MSEQTLLEREAARLTKALWNQYGAVSHGNPWALLIDPRARRIAAVRHRAVKRQLRRMRAATK